MGARTQVILAIDGLQPQVGHEVLWVIRDCISESILLARSLLSSRGSDISKMLLEVVEALPQNIVAVVSDGQLSIRNAVVQALPNTPHQLCHCYQIENLPKTNNDLEQVFGFFRHHTRRTTGRKKAPASILIRGSSRLIAAVVTRIKTFTATDLATVDLVSWRHQRSQLELLRQTRFKQRRFRCDPKNYLLKLETKLIQSILPP